MGLIAPVDVSHQPPTPTPWRLSDGARSYIMATQAMRPELEASFACGTDMSARVLTTASFVGWGTQTRGFVHLGDFPPGSVFLHTHPGRQWEQACGSEQDLACAMQLAEHGVGFAVLNSDGLGPLVMREPRPMREPTGPLPKVWSFGRLTVIWNRSKP